MLLRTMNPLIALCGLFATFVPIFPTSAKEDINLIKPSKPEDAPPKNPLSRGWNDEINWMNLEDGLKLSKEQKKPAFVLIHKTWCHACQILKKTFSKAKVIEQLSKYFVMINCEDDEEPWEEDFAPEGGKYIPRLLFVDPDGSVLKDVRNPKEEFKEYPYYYSNPAPIITAMKQVLNKYNIEFSDKPAVYSETQEKSGKGAAKETKPDAIDDDKSKKAKKQEGKKKETKSEL